MNTVINGISIERPKRTKVINVNFLISSMSAELLLPLLISVQKNTKNAKIPEINASKHKNCEN